MRRDQVRSTLRICGVEGGGPYNVIGKKRSNCGEERVQHLEVNGVGSIALDDSEGEA